MAIARAHGGGSFGYMQCVHNLSARVERSAAEYIAVSLPGKPSVRIKEGSDLRRPKVRKRNFVGSHGGGAYLLLYKPHGHQVGETCENGGFLWSLTTATRHHNPSKVIIDKCPHKGCERDL